MKFNKSFILSIFSLLALIVFWNLLVGCSPRQQAAFQTEAAKAGQTAVAEGAKAVQTQAARVAQTAFAEAANAANTRVAQVKQTAEAELTKQIGKLIPGKEIDYFALGDSIASGHGLMDDNSECHRSTRGYPYKFEAFLKTRYDKVNFYVFACSGATAKQPKDADLLRKVPHKWFFEQYLSMLQRLSKDRPTLVTITIGANDYGWADGSFGARLVEPSVDPLGGYFGWIQKTGEEVAQELRPLLTELLSHSNVVVVITDLYNPINQQDSVLFSIPIITSKVTVGTVCKDVWGVLTCYDRSKYLVDALNNSLVLDLWVPLGRPQNMRVTLINPKFYGHESPRPKCGKGAPDINNTWIQYPGQPGINGDPKELGVVTKEKYGDCFHPNEEGARQIAQAINDVAIRLGR